MRRAKLASLTANLLARKGEATASAVEPFPDPHSRGGLHFSNRVQIWRGVTPPPADAETIGYIPVKRGTAPSQLFRLAREAGEIILPVAVHPNADGSVMLTLLDSTENFRPDAGTGGWIGDGGSFLTGDPRLFSEATGWYVAITLTEKGRPFVELCHHGQNECTGSHWETIAISWEL